MKFVKEIREKKEDIRPYTGEKRIFTYFAWLPKKFYNRNTRTQITIWLESYSVERIFYRGPKQIYDCWPKYGYLVGMEGFKEK